MPKASSSPNSAPEAPTVGHREPISQVTSNCAAAAASTLASRNCQVALAAPQALELGAEHPQAQHVEEQVRHVAVQEARS